MKDVRKHRTEVIEKAAPFNLCAVRLYSGDVIKLNSQDETYILYGYEKCDDELILKLTPLSTANDKKFEIGNNKSYE